MSREQQEAMDLQMRSRQCRAEAGLEPSPFGMVLMMKRLFDKDDEWSEQDKRRRP